MNILVEEVVNKYSNMVIQIVYQRVLNMNDAEDITQEVFLKLLDNQEKIKNDEHLKAWLIRVAINECNDFNKNYWNKNTDGLNEYDEICIEDDSKEVFEELKKLTPQMYRDILYLYFYQGYKIKEIAKIMNLSPNTVGSALTRAKEKMKKLLEEEKFYE